MSALSAIQKAAKESADAVTSDALKTIQTLDTAFQTLFPFKTLGEATAQFSAGDVSVPNDVLVKALAASQEAIDQTVVSCMTMERYILLTIPKMEDGNNFGVTVQLAALKQLKDDREKLEKCIEELSKYPSARADAMEKCKLPSSSKSKTTTQSTSSSDVKGGEKEGTSTTSAKSDEEKIVATESQLAEASFRQQAVIAVDILYYSKARNAYMSAVTAFMTAADFLDKNQEKISAPKGSGGGRGYSSMY